MSDFELSSFESTGHLINWVSNIYNHKYETAEAACEVKEVLYEKLDRALIRMEIENIPTEILLDKYREGLKPMRERREEVFKTMQSVVRVTTSNRSVDFLLWIFGIFSENCTQSYKILRKIGMSDEEILTHENDELRKIYIYKTDCDDKRYLYR